MMKILSVLSVSALTFVFATTAIAATGGDAPRMDKRVMQVPYDPSFFYPDPSYEFEAYDPEKQMEIYGGKAKFDVPQPLLSLGRNIYDNGPFDESSYIFGPTNPVDSKFYIYGDLRTAIASNDNGIPQQSLLSTRLNLDIDWQLTGTERLHAFINPLQDNGRFTRYDISGDVDGKGTLEFNAAVDALFFEGDLGNIINGFAGTYSSTDMPFAIGLMPLLFQNGVWVNDAFTGIAFTIPHINSKMFDISNMDITFFAGFDKVSSPLGEDDVNMYGITAFIEANQGYWEVGYGFTDGTTAALDAQSYHNFTVAFTRRYWDTVSNSIRIITNFGQDDSLAVKSADGTLLLIENSLVTSLPSTLIPYLNLFYGDGRPQSLARAGGAGGVLVNTGINFETDGMTGFPTLDASANDTAGAALGVEYLFDLSQQIVVEIASVTVLGNDPARIANGDQLAFGVRYQLALDRAWIARADAMVAKRDNDEDLSGIRVEIRRKF
jgi:hypothetical protein